MTSIAEVTAPEAPFFSKPDIYSSIETHVLYGEKLERLGVDADFLRVRSSYYSTEGYVRQSDVRMAELHRPSPSVTHRVSVLRAPVHHRSSFKKPDPFGTVLPLNALVRVTEYVTTDEGVMAYVPDLGWIFNDQLRATGESFSDYVAVAEMFAGPGYPYVWGGDDCSWIIQQSLRASGITCPRNAGEQATRLGVRVDTKEPGFAYQRGDFVFWTETPKSRHVVLMLNKHECVHTSIAQPRHAVCTTLAHVALQQKEDGNGTPNVVRRYKMRK